MLDSGWQHRANWWIKAMSDQPGAVRAASEVELA